MALQSCLDPDAYSAGWSRHMRIIIYLIPFVILMLVRTIYVRLLMDSVM